MDLGAKIRMLRKERGLSQEEVGRGVLTRSMISAIERGKARPSLRALEVIAQALGKPVDYFLEDEATDQNYKRVRAHLTVSQALLAVGDAATARELLLSVLPSADHLGYRAMEVRIALGRAELILGHTAAARRELEACLAPEEGVLPEETAEARLYLGHTYLALGQPQEALAQLENAFPALRRAEDQLRCLVAMARCHEELANPSQAVARLRQAQALVDGQALDEQGHRRLREAQGHLAAGSFEAATREATLSQSLFELVGVAKERERLPLLLGRALAQGGAEGQALRILRSAFRQAVTEGRRGQAAEALTEMATIHRSLGRRRAARALLSRALTMAREDSPLAHVKAAHLLSSLVREVGDLPGAQALLREAAQAADHPSVPAALQVEVYTSLADVLRALGSDREAYDWLAKAHALVGGALGRTVSPGVDGL